jgi:hypothetical protein
MLCAQRVAEWRFIVLDNTIEEDALLPTHLMRKKNKQATRVKWNTQLGGNTLHTTNVPCSSAMILTYENG